MFNFRKKYDYSTYKNEGLIKELANNEDFFLCNLVNYGYYLIYAPTGLGIPINKEKLRIAIEQPIDLLQAFTNLPNDQKQNLGIVLSEPAIYDWAVKAKESGQFNNSNNIDIELEEQIMQEFGMVGKRK